MSANAPGQLLGYVQQFPRALYHLLRCGPEDNVCLEVFGDVATLSPDANITTEEDKSSQVGNPLTDRSTDLWKTFYNWIHNINSGTLDVQKTRFILFSNKSGRNGIVNAFHRANDNDTANRVIASALQKLRGVTNTHEIWPFYNYVINTNRSILLKIIPRFELQIGSGGGYDEIHKELRRMHIPESQVDFMTKSLSGWLQKVVVGKLSGKQDAILTWIEFSQEFSGLFQRAQKRELIDFTLISPPDEREIKRHIKERPLFIRQLEEINADDDDIQKAAEDYIKAKVNRFNWIEKELIDEVAAIDFESKLQEFWKNQKKKLDITQRDRAVHEKGMLLFLDCSSRQETIKEQSPPAATISGTYHALADTPVLGWHPNWEITFKK